MPSHVDNEKGSNIPIAHDVNDESTGLPEKAKQHRWFLIWIFAGALVCGVVLSATLTWYLTQPSKVGCITRWWEVCSKISLAITTQSTSTTTPTSTTKTTSSTTTTTTTTTTSTTTSAWSERIRKRKAITVLCLDSSFSQSYVLNTCVSSSVPLWSCSIEYVVGLLFRSRHHNVRGHNELWIQCNTCLYYKYGRDKWPFRFDQLWSSLLSIQNGISCLRPSTFPLDWYGHAHVRCQQSVEFELVRNCVLNSLLFVCRK